MCKLVGELGVKKWSQIAAQLDGRLGKQCRERWYNHLDPTIRREPWDESEDRLIIDLQHRLGNKWAEMATEIPGRCVPRRCRRRGPCSTCSVHSAVCACAHTDGTHPHRCRSQDG